MPMPVETDILSELNNVAITDHVAEVDPSLKKFCS